MAKRSKRKQPKNDDRRMSPSCMMTIAPFFKRISLTVMFFNCIFVPVAGFLKMSNQRAAGLGLHRQRNQQHNIVRLLGVAQLTIVSKAIVNSRSLAVKVVIQYGEENALPTCHGAGKSSSSE